MFSFLCTLRIEADFGSGQAALGLNQYMAMDTSNTRTTNLPREEELLEVCPDDCLAGRDFALDWPSLQNTMPPVFSGRLDSPPPRENPSPCQRSGGRGQPGFSGMA